MEKGTMKGIVEREGIILWLRQVNEKNSSFIPVSAAVFVRVAEQATLTKIPFVATLCVCLISSTPQA